MARNVPGEIIGWHTFMSLQQIFRYLRNVTIEEGFGKPDIAFSSDGTLQNVELKIMNLRPGLGSNLVWEEVIITNCSLVTELIFGGEEKTIALPLLTYWWCILVFFERIDPSHSEVGRNRS